MRAAQAAFARQDYDAALAEAQKVLREDTSQSEAKRLVENALSGQRAEARFRAAEAALGRGEYAEASSEAEAGRTLAPWDARATDLLARAQAGRERAQLQLQQQQRAQMATQIAGLLKRADEALDAQKYESALSLYDEVLRLDPQNARADLGRTGARAARATMQAAANAASHPAQPAGKSFVSGKTVAQSAETRAAGSAPDGFEESPNLAVRRGTQAAQMPGKIVFDIRPEPVRVGESYSVTVSFSNEGASSIPLKDVTVTTAVSGRRAGGAIQLSVTEVAPRQKVVLLSQSDLWREDFTSWSMEVTYRNQVTWR
jgi:tetratricopeptide (TPR) repeat protein